MAVTSVTVSHEGWTGSADIREGRKYQVTYIVQVNDPQDGADSILSSSLMPSVGSSYDVGNDRDDRAALKSIALTPQSGSRNLWTAVATYEKVKPEEGDDGSPTEGTNAETGEPEPDPTLWAANLQFSTVRVSRAAEWGAYFGQRRFTKQQNQAAFVPLVRRSMNFKKGIPIIKDFARGDVQGRIINGVAITNSVFHPYDPAPEVDYSRINIRYNFNTDHFPTRYLKFVNAINRNAFTIDHSVTVKDEDDNDKDLITKFFVPKYCMKILGCNVQAKSVNGIGFFDVTVETEVDTLFGYRLNILDRGYSTTADGYKADDPAYENAFSSTPILDEHGQRSSEPVLLDGNGEPLNLEENAAVYLEYGVYPEKAFTALKFDQPNQMKNVK